MTPAEALAAIRDRPTATVDEVADVLEVHPRTVRSAISRDELPSIRVAGRVVVPVARLLALLEPEPQSTVVQLPVRRDAEGIAAAVEILRGALAALERLAERQPSAREEPRTA